ncbi:MAG: type II toxin-antitoxin system HicA family toxin [Planctomycetia bacterium]|nr:type II toxin-antitoxin system HicA family toxin [Planctomycetia bacterium]
MSKLPSVTAREAVAALQRAGFVEHHQHGSHRHLKHPLKRLRVIIPMHAGDLKPGTLRAIMKQAGMTVDEFLLIL